MRKFIMLFAVIALLAMVIAPATQAISTNCAYARYHPGFAIACFWEIFLDMGGGWQDGPSNSSSMYGGDSDDLGTSSQYGGDADGVAGVRGDGDDVSGRR